MRGLFTGLSDRARCLVVMTLAFCGSSSIGYAQLSGTFTKTGPMTMSRSLRTATLLPSGKVLVIGGFQSTKLSRRVVLASTELYDPVDGAFHQAAAMATARGFHSATLLADGRVLIAGGYNDDD